MKLPIVKLNNDVWSIMLHNILQVYDYAIFGNTISIFDLDTAGIYLRKDRTPVFVGTIIECYE